MKKLSLSMIIVAFVVSACAPTMHHNNSNRRSKRVFITECSTGSTSVCKRRAANRCGGSYTTLSQKSARVIYRDPVYRTRYVHNYRYVQGANGQMRRVPYNNRHRYVSHYRNIPRNVTQMRYTCK